MISAYKKDLLSVGSGIFIAVFFTSLIIWVLGNKMGNIYLFSGDLSDGK